MPFGAGASHAVTLECDICAIVSRDVATYELSVFSVATIINYSHDACAALPGGFNTSVSVSLGC